MYFFTKTYSTSFKIHVYIFIGIPIVSVTEGNRTDDEHEEEIHENIPKDSHQFAFVLKLMGFVFQVLPFQRRRDVARKLCYKIRIIMT